MSALTRDQILGADDRPTETVSVPEWGGTVVVRALTGAERDAYETGVVSPRADGRQSVNLRNLRARLVALSCVDEDGNRLFGDGDVEALGNLSAHALDRVFHVARRLAGLGEDDVEEMAEGFGDAPSEGFTSD